MSSQFPDLDPSASTVSPQALKARLDAGEEVTILDTRRPADYESWRLEHPNARSVNVPFYEFLDDDERPVSTLPDAVPDGPVVVNCAVGTSSQFVGDLLVGMGREAEVVEDGMEGWARVYEATPVDAGVDATILQYHRPSSGCLGYVIVDGEEGMVIDPLRAFADRYRTDVRERDADLMYAADSHVHADHVSGVRRVRDLTGGAAVVPSGTVDRGLAFDPDRTVRGGDELQVGDTTVSVVDLPGHTTEMVGFRVGDVLVCGDTLFADGVARPDLEAGAEGVAEAAGRLFDTVRKIGGMPDDTLVAPGHTATAEPTRPDGTFTARLGDLEERIWAFDVDRETFVDRLVGQIPPRPNNYERIVAVNLGRAQLPEESEAFRIELGPNNCAASD